MFLSKSTVTDMIEDLRDDLTNQYDKKHNNLVDIIEQQQITIDEQRELLNQLTPRINIIHGNVSTLMDLKLRKESDEPWIGLDGGDIDPSKGIQLKLDWNDAFINQLRSQGYRGISETELVGQYLLQLSNMVGNKEQSNSMVEQ